MGGAPAQRASPIHGQAGVPIGRPRVGRFYGRQVFHPPSQPCAEVASISYPADAPGKRAHSLAESRMSLSFRLLRQEDDPPKARSEGCQPLDNLITERMYSTMSQVFYNNWPSGAMAALVYCRLRAAALLIPSAATAQAVAAPSAAVASRRRPGRQSAVKKKKALFRDFMGLNVHSIGFKPELYKPVCRLVRDYHPMVWDLGRRHQQCTHPVSFP